MGNKHVTLAHHHGHQAQHTISSKHDAIIAVTGYLRYCIEHLEHLQHHSVTLTHEPLRTPAPPACTFSLTSYNLFPVCIIRLIVQFYYFNQNERTEMNEPKLRLSALKVGDKIDAKDDWEKYYGATVLFIKEAHTDFPINSRIQRLSVSPGIKYLYPADWNSSLGLFVHYNGCSSRYDEWIFVKAHTICDCRDTCHYKDVHFIAKHNTQSKRIGLGEYPQFGAPRIEHAVGLANLSNTSWLSAVLQSLYHCREFRHFINDAAYLHLQDGSASGGHDGSGDGSAGSANPRQRLKRYAQFVKHNPFVIRLHDLFSAMQSREFNVVSPLHVYHALLADKQAPQFPLANGEANGEDKPFQFLHWMLQKMCARYEPINRLFEGRYQYQLHHDRPNTDDIETQTQLAVAPRNHKISRWFAKLRHKHGHEEGADATSHAYTDAYHHLYPSQSMQCTFLSLTLPIIHGMQRDLLIDVYDARNSTRNHDDSRGLNGLRPPVRHRVRVRRDGKVSDLETILSRMYRVQADRECLFFYRLWGFRCCYVWNSFEPLSDVDDTIACYILDDWTPTNHICHVHHVREINKPELHELSQDAGADGAGAGAVGVGGLRVNVNADAMIGAAADMIPPLSTTTPLHDNYDEELESSSSSDDDSGLESVDSEEDCSPCSRHSDAHVLSFNHSDAHAHSEDGDYDADMDDVDDMEDDMKQTEHSDRQHRRKIGKERMECDDDSLKHHYHYHRSPRHYQHHHAQIHMNDKHVIHPFAFGIPFIVSLPHNHTTGRLVHKIVYHQLYTWIGDEEILPRPPSLSISADNTNEDNESAWDVLLVNLPYALRWVHKDYNFYFDGYKPPVVTADDVRINYTWNYHANIVVEWKQSVYPTVKALLNKIDNTQEPKNVSCVHDPPVMSIYDCIRAFCRNGTSADGDGDHDSNNIQNAAADDDTQQEQEEEAKLDHPIAGSSCSNEDEVSREPQLKLWALPGVLVLHFPRFYQFTLERLNKTETRSGFIPSVVQYPIYNLDLSPFMADDLTMNARFDLFAVVCHCGTNHFYTLCKTQGGEWLKFEDSKITKIHESSVVNNKAIILFYKKTKQSAQLQNHSFFNRYF